MIFGIGTDIVRVARMQKNIERYGEKFAERILTPAELSEYRKESRQAHFLAKRFAAKEAAAKVKGSPDWLAFLAGKKSPARSTWSPSTRSTASAARWPTSPSW